MPRRFLTLSILLALVITATPVLAEINETLQRTFEVSPGGRLVVDTFQGSIDVVSGSSNQVEVEVHIRARTNDRGKFDEMMGRIELDMRERGGDVFIHAETQNRNRWWGSGRDRPRLEYKIRVPHNYNLDLKTSGGSIEVEDLEGLVEANTSGGSLRFGRIMGEVNGKTSGGSITLTSSTGNADLRTSGGSITIGEVEGDVLARTSGGSINVDEVFGSIEASTSGGSVNARISNQPEHDCTLTTSGGTVSVSLMGGVAVDLDAKTSSGRVVSEFEVEGASQASSRSGSRWDDERRKRELRGPINGGGPRLVLRTSGGNIHVKQLGR